MPAVSTFILNSLIMSGEKAMGTSTFTQSESTYHLSRFNSMLDGWWLESLMIPYLSQTSFALTASQGSYTIGNGGDFNMTRPNEIVDPCFIRDSQDNDYELQIIDMVAYGRLADKTADGSYPIYLAYDKGYSATSTGTVYFWPEPVASLTTFINTNQPLITCSTITQNLILPPGYQDAIETNYAVKSALGQFPIAPELERAAIKSKAMLKSYNLKTPVSRLDYGIGGGMRSNILIGP